MDQVDVTLRAAKLSNDSTIYRLVLMACIWTSLLMSKLPPRFIESVIDSLMNQAGPCSFEAAQNARNDVIATNRVCAGEGCLERSLATVFVCGITGRGLPAWVVGARIEPFRAHSWVEVNGIPVGESIAPDFVPLISLSPTRPSK